MNLKRLQSFSRQSKSNVEITGVENAPFEPKYKEELCIGGERELTWKKINVDGRYGFAEIDYVGDVAQIYADGELVADDYYYGKTSASAL